MPIGEAYSWKRAGGGQAPRHQQTLGVSLAPGATGSGCGPVTSAFGCNLRQTLRRTPASARQARPPRSAQRHRPAHPSLRRRPAPPALRPSSPAPRFSLPGAPKGQCWRGGGRRGCERAAQPASPAPLRERRAPETHARARKRDSAPQPRVQALLSVSPQKEPPPTQRHRPEQEAPRAGPLCGLIVRR